MPEKMKIFTSWISGKTYIYYYGNNQSVLHALRAISDGGHYSAESGNYISHYIFTAKESEVSYVRSESFKNAMRLLGADVVQGR